MGQGGFGKIDLYKFQDSEIIIKKIHNPLWEKIRWYSKAFFHLQRNPISPFEKRKNLLLHEYYIGRLLDHKSIRKTISIDIKYPCLFLEYFKGIDLCDFLNTHSEKILNIKLKLKIFEDIVKAIDYMHSKHVAHLDLKLENIMINEVDYSIRIIDFGKSFQWKKGNKEFSLINVISSYEYMSPEEFTDINKELKPDKIDIWAIGLVLYCLLYNSFPWNVAVFSDRQFYSHINFLKCGQLSPMIFKDIPQLTSSQNNIIKTIFKKCLCLTPKDRINTREILYNISQLELI